MAFIQNTNMRIQSLKIVVNANILKNNETYSLKS